MLNAGVMTRPSRDLLTEAWHDSVGGCDSSPERVAATLDELRERHREPHRRYHTLEHLDEVLIAVRSLSDLTTNLPAVRLAACFHDAVYQPSSPTNEIDSARLATDRLGALGLPGPMVDAVADLILTTAHHRAPPDSDAAVLADADLWILGAPAERYARYAVDVRAEYAHIDDDAWRAGRATVLDDFLARDHLYATARLRADREPTARRNLRDERRTL
jgi:predicted metal-dependent HD superfamily phosphohydrolase